MVSLTAVRVEVPEGMNVIIGQSHFIKTVPDLYETLVASSPHLKFGIAFSEASGHCLVRHEGNDKDLEQESDGCGPRAGMRACFCHISERRFPH